MINKYMSTTSIQQLSLYRKTSLAKFYELTDVTNHTILEIGGVQPHEIPHDLVLHGAKSIFIVNKNLDPMYFSPEQVTDKITAIHTDAATLTFLDNTFDSIISVLTIQRIRNLSEVLAEAYRVLKPNGVMYINGTPLWSAKLGAHYTFTVNDIEYHRQNNRILSDWEHLTSTEEGIRSRLTGIYSNEVIEFLIYDVYTSTHLNRLFPAEIMEIVSNSKFEIVSSELSISDYTDMPNNIKELVKLKYPKFDNGYDSLDLYLRKPVV